MGWLWHEKETAKKAGRAILELQGDPAHRDPVTFIRREDGSVYIWIDGGEGGDTEMGFYSIEADRALSAEEIQKLVEWLMADQ